MLILCFQRIGLVLIFATLSFIAQGCSCSSSSGGGGSSISGGGGDNIAPSVTGTNPDSDLAELSLNFSLAFIFSESLDESTVNDSNVTLETPRGSVSGDVSYDDSSFRATFAPNTSMPLAAPMTGRAKTGIMDKAGNALQSEFSIGLRTRDGIFVEHGQIESDDDQDEIIQDFRVVSSGKAFLVWSQRGSMAGRYDIYANTYDPSMGWATPELLAMDTVIWANAGQPRIVGNNNGDAVVFWEDKTDNQAPAGIDCNDWAFISAKVFDPATQTWGPTEFVTPIGAVDASWPEVEMDEAGNVLALWKEGPGCIFGPFDLYAAVRNADTDAWGAKVPLETTSSDSSGYRLSMDSQGNAMAFWHQNQLGDASPFDVVGAYYEAASGAWIDQMILDTSLTENCFAGDVEFLSDGSALVAWRQGPGFNYRAFASHYVPGMGWEADMPLEPTVGDVASGPSIAAGHQADAMIAWGNVIAGEALIQTSFFQDSSGFQGPLVANETGTPGFPFFTNISLGMDAAGHGYVTYLAGPFGAADLMFNHFVPGAGWGDARKMDSAGDGDGGISRMNVDPFGNVLLLWQEEEIGGREDIFYDRMLVGEDWVGGQPLEREDVGEAVSPRLGMDDMGRGISIWLQDDGSNPLNIWSSVFE